jgi:hypothetical protein
MSLGFKGLKNYWMIPPSIRGKHWLHSTHTYIYISLIQHSSIDGWIWNMSGNVGCTMQLGQKKKDALNILYKTWHYCYSSWVYGMRHWECPLWWKPVLHVSRTTTLRQLMERYMLRMNWSHCKLQLCKGELGAGITFSELLIPMPSSF